MGQFDKPEDSETNIVLMNADLHEVAPKKPSAPPRPLSRPPPAAHKPHIVTLATPDLVTPRIQRGASAPRAPLPPVSFPAAMETLRRSFPALARTETPFWVFGYVALCAALTIIGLFVLALESIILGHGGGR